MAYNGPYEGGPGGNPYGGGRGGGGGGPAPQRPPPQRQYPQGPGGPPPPPQQYDQYQDGYDYPYDDYGNGYNQGYDGQYNDMGSFERGPPPSQYPPQDYYEPGPPPPNGPPGRGRPMPGGMPPRGRGGPMRPPPGEGGRGGPYPPRGGGYPGGPPGGPGRGYPPQGRGGRPGPPERAVNSDPGASRGPPMNGPGPGPMSPPGDQGFGDSAFPTFPGAQRRTNLDQERQIIAGLEGMNINSRNGPRGPGGPMPRGGPMRSPPNGFGGPGPGPMGPPRGPPQPYPPQDYPEQRRGPPPGPGYGPPMGGYPEENFGPPGRSMTMPMRGGMDMSPPGPGQLPRRETGPFNGPMGRGMPPPRPNTAQGVRGAPPRIYPPNNVPPLPQDGYSEPMPRNQTNSGYGQQERPASMDDFYDYYDDRESTEYPAQNPPSAWSEPRGFAEMDQQRPRGSLDHQMPPGGGPEQAQRGPGRVAELSRTKSQPDLRSSQTAIFEMAGDIPPLPTQNGPQQQQQFGRDATPPNGRPSFQQSPPQAAGMAGPGLPPGPTPYRPPAQPAAMQDNSNPDSLPSHPTPGQGLPPAPAPYRPMGPPMPQQGGSNPDGLPSHPTPVRPGLMQGSLVNVNERPPPVRNYSNVSSSNTNFSNETPRHYSNGTINTSYSGDTMMGPPAGPPQGRPQGPPSGPAPSNPWGPVPPPQRPQTPPVSIDELEQLRARVKTNPEDSETALRLAKRLVEAADVLVPNLPDPKARARSRERYQTDALKILRKLEKNSHAEAMFFLADCLGRGMLGGEPDSSHAFSLYQSAAKLGNAAAAYRTAVCCEIGNDEGGGTRKDPLKAIQWYKRAATLGDTPAMYKMGIILLKGLLGQPRNPREAISWLKRAAERADAENPHALHELALLYASAEPNDVILRDEAYAFELFLKAGRLGYKYSQFRLGCAFEFGLYGCPIDPRLSIEWYSAAAIQEEHQSELALAGWYMTGSEGILAQNDAEAYLWAKKAAAAGLAKAEYAMGHFLELGIGVPPNLEDAKRWYWRAAAKDFPKARERLEELKRSGKAGPRDRERISRSKISKQNEGECIIM